MVEGSLEVDNTPYNPSKRNHNESYKPQSYHTGRGVSFFCYWFHVVRVVGATLSGRTSKEKTSSLNHSHRSWLTESECVPLGVAHVVTVTKAQVISRITKHNMSFVNWQPRYSFLRHANAKFKEIINVMKRFSISARAK